MEILEKKEKRVSIVIPCFNYARFLAEAVETSLAQDYSDIEVLVIDDGSTDESAKVARSFGDRIVYIYQENQGLSAARNTGIREASGEFVVFLDADDRFEPSMVSVCLEKLTELGKGFALIVTQTSLMDAEGQRLRMRHVPLVKSKEIHTKDLLIRNRFTANIMVRKSVFAEVGGFDTNLKASEDRDMWIRISLVSRLYLLKEFLVWNRRHGDNMSSNAARQTAAIRQVLAKARGVKALKGMEIFFWLKIWSFYYYQAGLLFNPNILKSYRLLLMSLILWPWYLKPAQLGERVFFRMRIARWITGQWWMGKFGGGQGR